MRHLYLSFKTMTNRETVSAPTTSDALCFPAVCVVTPAAFRNLLGASFSDGLHLLPGEDIFQSCQLCARDLLDRSHEDVGDHHDAEE